MMLVNLWRWRKFHNAGNAAYEKENYAEAERQFHAGLDIAMRLGPMDSMLATSIRDLAKLYNTPKTCSESQHFIKRWKLTASNQARAYDRLGVIYRPAGISGSKPDYSNFERALTIREEVLGPDHLEVARSLERLARCYGYFRNNESKRLLKRALAIWEQALGPEHPEVARSLERLARCYGYYRNPEGEVGLQLLKRSLAILEKTPKQEHVLNQLLVRNAPTLRRLGRTAVADRMETLSNTLRAKFAQDNEIK